MSFYQKDWLANTVPVWLWCAGTRSVFDSTSKATEITNARTCEAASTLYQAQAEFHTFLSH